MVWLFGRYFGMSVTFFVFRASYFSLAGEDAYGRSKKMITQDNIALAIERVREGDSDSFAVIVRECEPAVRVYFGSRLRNATEVDDLTQETFIACYQGLKSFQKDTEFMAWLIGIAKHKLASFFRKSAVQADKTEHLRQLIFDQVENRLMERVGEFVQEKVAHLPQCLEKLGGRVREMLVAKYFRGERVQSIAERSGTTPNAVSAVLLRGRKQLENCLNSNTLFPEAGHD
ncbi:MAG: hypothetical protein C0404_12060 [Verrucomicrobia bacterium]|nr:hypothetical protein [Verrucomicrobiota bacterium]